MLGLQRWKAGTLLAAWIAYWAVLVGVTIGPGLLRAWRLTREPGSRVRMSASIDAGRLLLDVNDAGGAVGAWSFNTSIAAALAWIALPPLALWVLWLVSRPRRDSLAPGDVAMLGTPGTAMPVNDTITDQARGDRVNRRS